MSTTTTNYSLVKPAVNDPTDEDLWGTELNATLDLIDSFLKVATDTVHANLSSNTTISNSYRNKIILGDATSAAFTVTLQPAATAGDGFRITVKKTDSTGNIVTVKADGTELIDGANTYVLIASQYDVATFVCDGTKWELISNKTTPTAVPDGSTSVKGIVQLATAAQAKTGTDATLVVTPAGLGGLSTLGTSGKFVIGGLTIQWGTITGNLSGGSAVTFGTAFSGTAYNVVTAMSNTAGGVGYHGWSNITSSGFTITTSFAGTATVNWIAIGPT